MKKANFTLSVAATLLLVIAFGKANAQTARLQLIHNASAVTLDTVDVYLDNTKFDNVAFRTATQLLDVASGAHKVNVNDRNSADSGDMVLSSFTLNLPANQIHVAMIAGVDVPANYVANPNGLSTALSLVVRNNILVSPASNTQTALNFLQGVTDAPTWDIYLRPSTSIANDIRFGESSANSLTNSVATVIDVRDATGSLVIKSYNAALSAYAKKSLVVFASGFMTPASNQNGAAFGVFAVDTNGGAATALTEAARMQFVHASPDYTVDTVDIWLNDTKLVDDLPFRSATAMLSMPVGTYDVTIAKKTSVDTSAAVTLTKITGFNLLGGSTWVGLVKGVIDTTLYASNPDGLDRSFSLGLNPYREGSLGQIDLGFFNGVPDGATVDFNKIGSGAAKIADSASYSTLTNPVTIAAGNTLFNLTSADSTQFYGAYKLNTTGLAPRGGFVMTSGVLNTAGNPAQAKKVGLFAVFNDGTVTPLVKLTSDVQIVHNSADVTNDSVDIYINGIKTIDNMAFRSATTFMTMDALVPYSIAVAPQTSTNVSAAFYTTNLMLDSGTNYYVIAAGVKNTSLYAVNPNGRNIGFKLFTYKDARKVAVTSKNTDLLYFHGAPDLMATTMMGVGQVQFLSKNDAYGDFHGYAIHSAQDNIRYDIMDAAADTVIKTVYGSLASHQGKAGLVFASGFLKTNATTNQNGDTLLLFVAWPDGKVDSIAPAKIATGLNEQVIAGSKMEVYPNPAKDIVNITMELTRQNNVVYEVIDITGKRILSQSYAGISGKNTITIPTASLNVGMYFVSIRVNDQIITRKISVSK